MIDVDVMKEAIEAMGALQRECRIHQPYTDDDERPPAIEVFNDRIGLDNGALTFAIIETLRTTDLNVLVGPEAQGLATGIQLGIFAAREEARCQTQSD